MLNTRAFANSVALTTGLCYIVFYLISLGAKSTFNFLFNAQFFGADISSLMPGTLSFGAFLGILVSVVIMVWIFAYIWAVLYNRFKKE